MIASSDPVWTQAKRTFRGRILNASIGAVVGLVFLSIGGPREWKLPVALAVTVILSTYVVRIPVMWRQAPITAAIVIADGVTHGSKITGIEHGFNKVVEVIFGCCVGIAVSWIMSRIWPVAPPHAPDLRSRDRAPRRSRRPEDSHPMSSDLAGKVFIVTGSSTGIGRVTARELARRGGHVFLANRSEARTAPVLERDPRRSGSGRAEFLPLDLADLASVRAAAGPSSRGGSPCTGSSTTRGWPASGA